MKVNSTVYKGIEFVEISALPNEQKTSLLQTLDPELLIKILVDGKLITRCVQFKDYEEWYDNFFQPKMGGTQREVKSATKSSDQKVNANMEV